MPSRPSALVNKDSDNACSSGMVCGCRRSCLVAASAFGPPNSRSRHSCATVADTSSVTCVTRPMSNAVVASNTSPVRYADASFDQPQRCRIGPVMIAGATPIRTSVNANVIDDSTTTRSHAAITPIPPARTGPLTAAITGAPIVPRRSIARTNDVESTSPVDRSLRSAPAQKTGAVCDNTTTRAFAASASSSAWCRSASSCCDSALRLAGESSVIVAMSSATATLTRCPTTTDCTRLGRYHPKKRLDICAHPSPTHWRERVDDLPPVAGLSQARIEHGDDAAVGGVADQSSGGLRQQHRRTGKVDLGERSRAEQLTTCRQQRIVGTWKRNAVDRYQ